MYDLTWFVFVWNPKKKRVDQHTPGYVGIRVVLLSNDPVLTTHVFQNPKMNILNMYWSTRPHKTRPREGLCILLITMLTLSGSVSLCNVVLFNRVFIVVFCLFSFVNKRMCQRLSVLSPSSNRPIKTESQCVLQRYFDSRPRYQRPLN